MIRRHFAMSIYRVIIQVYIRVIIILTSSDSPPVADSSM